MDLLKWFLDGIVRFYSQSPPAVQLFFLVVMLALIVLVTVWTTWSYFRKRHQLEGVKAERDGFKGQLQEKGYQVLELQTKLTTADGLCQQLQQQTQTLSTHNGQLQQQLSTEQQKLDAANQQ